MSESIIARPSDDPGDDMQRRVHYQNAYGVLLLLGMVDGIVDGVSIFFEQHEDLLVELADGKYVAIQIKTKDDPQPFRTLEAPIVDSLKRFIELHKLHGERIRKYVIVSSCGFRRDGSDKDLPAVLEAVRTITCAELATHALTSRLFAKIVGPNTPETIHEVLSATYTVEDAPGLSDIDGRLRVALDDLAMCAEALNPQLKEAFERLLAMATRAGSYRPEGINYDAVAIVEGSDSVDAAIVQQKRITVVSVVQTIEKCLKLPAPADFGVSSVVEKDHPTMRKKMTMAEIPARYIELANTLAFDAKYQLQAQKYRIGRGEAGVREVKLRAIVHAEFEKEFDKHLANGGDGASLFNAVKAATEHLSATRNVDGAEPEELLGIAGVMTDECKLWWTESRALPEAT